MEDTQHCSVYIGTSVLNTAENRSNTGLINWQAMPKRMVCSESETLPFAVILAKLSGAGVSFPPCIVQTCLCNPASHLAACAGRRAPDYMMYWMSRVMKFWWINGVNGVEA